MNLLEKLCKELGVGVEDVWLGSDGFKYKITQEGDLVFVEPNTDPKTKARISHFEKVDDMSRLLTESLKPAWRPKKGDEVYTICFLEDDYVYDFIWKGGTPWEQKMIETGLVFKTQEEAIACANKMLESVK